MPDIDNGVTALFDPVRKWIGFDQYTINSLVLSLNTTVTVALFLIFSLIVTAQQFIGDPIDCIVEEVPAGTFVNIGLIQAPVVLMLLI